MRQRKQPRFYLPSGGVFVLDCMGKEGGPVREQGRSSGAQRTRRKAGLTCESGAYKASPSTTQRFRRGGWGASALPNGAVDTDRCCFGGTSGHDKGAENPCAAAESGGPGQPANTPLPTEPAPQYKLKEWIARHRPRKPRKSEEHTNSYALLEDCDEDCTMAGRLRGKAITSIEFLSKELGLEPVRDLPERIRCGDLRAAVRSCFPDSLSLKEQLSIKTVQKLERSACRSCEPRFLVRLEKWREARFQPQEVDDKHLARFSAMVRENIPSGWNRRMSPFIPNGNASLGFKRREGGNWQEEEFSSECRYDLVFSSGKPRVVTMYSSYNTKVLKPLHEALYGSIARYGWVLVGPPTPERINRLTGSGDYLSFDYESATDNIKRQYVSAAVEAVIGRADPPLTDEQVRCVRVLSSLQLDGMEGEADSGQPMGSLMSFPLLCIINKTVVDLALTDLLQGGQLTLKEWSGHRCLINGDDLLTREPRKDSRLAENIFHHGGKVGLRTNWDKTLQSSTQAEINSTLFEGGELVKKSNAASLYMKPAMVDVLGYARESTSTVKGFRQVVRANVKWLALQARKGYRDLPHHLQRVCKSDRKIRAALTSGPAEPERQSSPNFFPVCPRPEGYNLSREEEIELIHRRVERVRPWAIANSGLKERRKGPVKVLPLCRTWRSVKYEKRPPPAEETILDVLAVGWEAKQKERMVEEEAWNPLISEIGPSDLPGGRVAQLVDAIRAFRNAKSLQCDPIWLAEAREQLGILREPDPFESGSEWIALE